MDNLTDKQIRFCQEYVIDWNATRSAKAAGYSEKTAHSIGHENLSKPEIQAYIEELKGKYEELAGISALSVMLELKKVGFSNMYNLHKTWFTLEEWESITPEEKACIASVKHSTRSVGEDGETIETIEVKLHDKMKALDMLNKMLGYNSAEKVNHSGGIKIEVEEKVMS